MVADIGSILDGNRAVKEGLIDSVGGLSSALGALRTLAKEKRKKIKEVSKKGKDGD
jgi:ClpP class serine protease